MKLTITALRTVTNQSEVTVKMPEGMDDAEFKSAIHFAEMNSSNLQDVASILQKRFGFSIAMAPTEKVLPENPLYTKKFTIDSINREEGSTV